MSAAASAMRPDLAADVLLHTVVHTGTARELLEDRAAAKRACRLAREALQRGWVTDNVRRAAAALKHHHGGKW